MEKKPLVSKKLLLPFLLLLIGFVPTGCQEKLEFPIEPQITYEGFQYLIDADSVLTGEGILSIGYTDGDGDLGLDDRDTLYPFGLHDPHYYNLLIDYLRWDGTQFVADTVNFNIRFKRLTANEDPTAIFGTFDCTLPLRNPLHPDDTVKLQIRVVDRALNVSNCVESEAICFKQ